MLISELIEKLEAVKMKHGDITVVCVNDYGLENIAVDEKLEVGHAEGAKSAVVIVPDGTYQPHPTV